MHPCKSNEVHNTPSVGWFDVEYSPEPPPRRRELFAQEENNDNDYSRSDSRLKEYLQSVVSCVEARGGNSQGGGPLLATELAELSMHANRDDAAFGCVDSETLTCLVQALYEHVLNATSVSILRKAGEFFASEDIAPSQSMVSLQEVCASVRLCCVIARIRIINCIAFFFRLSMIILFVLLMVMDSVDEKRRTLPSRNPATRD